MSERVKNIFGLTVFLQKESVIILTKVLEFFDIVKLPVLHLVLIYFF